MKLVVGLGNPDKKYEHTRHNVGFLVLDSLLGNITWKNKFNGLYYEVNYEGEKTIYLKPQTYMNNSGFCVQEFANFYNIEAKDILVIHDDIDMEFGKIRIKFNSTYGGHNGIKSIIDSLGQDFYHLKFGVGSNHNSEAKDYVLGKFSKTEIDFLQENMSKFSEIIDLFIKNDILSAMNKFN